MNTSSEYSLQENVQGNGQVLRSGNKGWHLGIPPGEAGRYRLAQLDDYGGLARGAFPWPGPVQISLRAKAASRSVPGTWGFGFWNDPFGLAVIKGSKVRFPSLPNSAWFFFASDSNYLSIRDDLPSNGQLAATFQSPSKPPVKLLLGLPLFSLVFVPPMARWLRRWLRQYIKQDARDFELDPCEWHSYEIERGQEKVTFKIDGQVIHETMTTPRGPLGLVIWIDNQYASWQPDGRIGYGTLANHDAAWLQIDDLEMSPA